MVVCVCGDGRPNDCPKHPRLPWMPPAEVWQPAGYDQSHVKAVPSTASGWGDGERWVIARIGRRRWDVFPPDQIYAGCHSTYGSFEEARRAFIAETVGAGA